MTSVVPSSRFVLHILRRWAVVNTEKVTPIWYQAFSDLVNEFNEMSVHEWSTQDLESFCMGYTEDAVMVTSAGIFKGRDAILQAYQEAYPDRSRMGTISAEVVDICFPPDDKDKDHDVLVSMAVAIIRCIVTLDGNVTEDGYSMVTFVLDHKGDMYIAQDTST